MPSRRLFLLLQLLCTAANLSEAILTGPRLVTAHAGNPGNATETDLNRHEPLWFDYPDSDEKKILAVYKLIGEQPEFIPPSSFPHQLRSILVGSIILILLFFLYQIISKVISKKSNPG